MDNTYINLIKKYIENSDFDENIILDTSMKPNLERSLFNTIDESVGLMKKVEGFLDNKDFIEVLKELQKKFSSIKENIL